MAHKRSFSLMTPDERALQRHFAEYKTELLSKNLLKPIFDWGFGGIDETLFILKSKLGSKAKKTKNLEKQVGYARPKQITAEWRTLKPETRKILYSTPNAATFSTLEDTITEYRRERLPKMNQESEKLYANERMALLKEKIASPFVAASQRLGYAGSFLRNNIILTGAVASFGVTAVSVPNYFSAKSAHRETADAYTESDVGKVAFPIKRTYIEKLEDAHSELDYEEEVTDSEGDVIVSENTSNPQRSRRYVLNAQELLANTTSANVISRLEITDKSRQHIYDYAQETDVILHDTVSSLKYSFNDEYQYSSEQRMIKRAMKSSKPIVNELETYMDHSIVEAEDAAYSKMRFWKFALFGSAGVGGVFAFNAARKGNNSRNRQKYY